MAAWRGVWLLGLLAMPCVAADFLMITLLKITQFSDMSYAEEDVTLNVELRRKAGRVDRILHISCATTQLRVWVQSVRHSSPEWPLLLYQEENTVIVKNGVCQPLLAARPSDDHMVFHFGKTNNLKCGLLPVEYKIRYAIKNVSRQRDPRFHGPDIDLVQMFSNSLTSKQEKTKKAVAGVAE